MPLLVMKRHNQLFSLPYVVFTLNGTDVDDKNRAFDKSFNYVLILCRVVDIM